MTRAISMATVAGLLLLASPQRIAASTPDFYQGKGGGQGQERGQGQGKGQGQERGQGAGKAQGRGQSDAARGNAKGAPAGKAEGAARAEGGGASRANPNSSAAARSAGSPAKVREMRASSRVEERVAADALARGAARGLRADAFEVRRAGNRVQLVDRAGAIFLDMDERSAREMGAWDVRPLADQPARGGAPSYCRSGAGHPVWGRQWCLDKGFGLGSDPGSIWSRGSIDDVIFGRRDDRERLDRGGLLDVLGDVVLGRLALQALSLGFAAPLVGSWSTDPQGPRILRVRSGDREVAEFVDADRNDRPELLYVVVPR